MIINLTFCDEFCVVSIIAKDKEIFRILMVQKCTACSLNFSLLRFGRILYLYPRRFGKLLSVLKKKLISLLRFLRLLE